MDESKAKVLLVEDVKIAQVVGANLLNSLNCKTDLAESGQQALELCNNNSYDFILMDIGLPDMPGFVVTEKIREMEKKMNKASVPIVALTANDRDDIKQASLQSGMTGFLSKPLTKEAILGLLNQFFCPTD